MKILLTGGSGFIGLNLQERLSKVHNIFAPPRNELDLLDSRAVSTFFKKHHFDAVIHCATWDAKWDSAKDPSMILDHNIRMFFNLVRERKRFGKLICLGSGAEFSKPHWIPFMTEDYFDTYVPTDPYGFSKYIINKYINHMEDAVNLRLFGVFGKHEDWRTRFISNAICRAIHNLPITIYQDVAFDYLYSADLINIIEWFLYNIPKQKAYNVCTNTANLLTTIAGMVLDALGKKLPVEVIKEGHGREYSGNNSLLLSEIKNLQFTPIAGAIKDLCLWYIAHVDLIPYQVISENARIAFLLGEETDRE